MDTLNAKPQLLKQANLSLIRKVIMAKRTATRAEIAEESKISSTTVRSLLAEMLRDGEIESMGYDKSSGGRKAERYRFQPNRYHGAAFCMLDYEIHALLINVCGEIVETTHLMVPNGEKDFERVICAFLDELVTKNEIKSIGLGVPGVVDGKSYWKKNLEDDQLRQINLGERLTQKYSVPVILENDLKATAIGFGRCYAKEFPCENPEDANMAYLHFEKGCISAGFIAGGRVIRGSKNFAGELGLIPLGGDKLLDEQLNEPMDDARYTQLVIQILGWICGILNPQYVALGGPAFRKSCLGPIGDGLSALLPRQMFAEILFSPDVWHDYHDGMAHLTAGKMFDEIQLIKE